MSKKVISVVVDADKHKLLIKKLVDIEKSVSLWFREQVEKFLNEK